MKVDFEITENYALSIAGRHIDLHNNFDFAGFEYNVFDKEIRLHWKRSIGEWIDKNEVSSLILIHSKVTFLNVINQDEKSAYNDDSRLEEITFFPSTAREINDSILPQSKPNEGDDILYFFGNGQVVRIHCDKIELSVKLPSPLLDNNFTHSSLTEEEAFWVMYYFLDRHFELAGGEFGLTDILSASQPFEFDDKGHFDGRVKGNRRIAPADNKMVRHWNEAVKNIVKTENRALYL